MSGSEINLAAAASEKLEVPSTDQSVSVVRVLKRRLRHGRLAAWVLDETRAYRQIPILPAHPKYSVVAVFDPLRKRVAFFVMVGHSFGVLAAVYNYQ